MENGLFDDASFFGSSSGPRQLPRAHRATADSLGRGRAADCGVGVDRSARRRGPHRPTGSVGRRARKDDGRFRANDSETVGRQRAVETLVVRCATGTLYGRFPAGFAVRCPNPGRRLSAVIKERRSTTARRNPEEEAHQFRPSAARVPGLLAAGRGAFLFARRGHSRRDAGQPAYPPLLQKGGRTVGTGAHATQGRRASSGSDRLGSARRDDAVRGRPTAGFVDFFVRGAERLGLLDDLPLRRSSAVLSAGRHSGTGRVSHRPQHAVALDAGPSPRGQTAGRFDVAVGVELGVPGDG